MINFRNPQELEIYNLFMDEFGVILSENSTTANVVGVNLNHFLSTTVNILDDPFATNKEVNPSPVVMNEPICNILNLTPREHFAMIAHEIGHIVDPTPVEGNNMQREVNADMFAVELGLTQDLINGLQKIIDSNNYRNQLGMIEERIRILNTL